MRLVEDGTKGISRNGMARQTTRAQASSLGNEERYDRGRNQSLVVSRRSHWKADARVARRALSAEDKGQHSTQAPGDSKTQRASYVVEKGHQLELEGSQGDGGAGGEHNCGCS